MDPKIIDHHFTVAAYTVTWVIQLSYLAWLGYRWSAEKRKQRRGSEKTQSRTTVQM